MARIFGIEASCKIEKVRVVVCILAIFLIILAFSINCAAQSATWTVKSLFQKPEQSLGRQPVC